MTVNQGDEMRKHLLKGALKIIHSRKNTSAWSEEELYAFFADEAIVVPNPGYGNVVYDVPDDYAFPELLSALENHMGTLRRFFSEPPQTLLFSSIPRISVG